MPSTIRTSRCLRAVTLEFLPALSKKELPEKIQQEVAALKVQRWYRRISCQILAHPKLERTQLIQRLNLERVVLHGLWNMIIYAIMFVCLFFALRATSSPNGVNSHKRLYEAALHLTNNQVSSLVTSDAVLEHLYHMTKASESFQRTSSTFYEDNTHVKLIQGVQTFQQAQQRTKLKLTVDSGTFSFTAWVRVPKSDDAQTIGIIYKPFRSGAAVQDQDETLYCWGWFYEAQSRSFKFGAHDHGTAGGSQTQLSSNLQKATRHVRTDVGSLNLEAIVVNGTMVSFWQNAFLIETIDMHRPVTDCTDQRVYLVDSLQKSVSTIELGDLTYYPRALNAEEMREILTFGASLNEVAYGRHAYDDMATEFELVRQTQQFLHTSRKTQTNHILQVVGEQHVLTQQVNAEHAPPAATQYAKPCYKHDTDPNNFCIIAGVTATRHMDEALSGRYSGGIYYYDLLPDSNGSKVYMPTAYHSIYDPATFPTWINQSVTLSWWMRSLGSMAGWLILKHDAWSNDRKKRCWGIWTSGKGLVVARRHQLFRLSVSTDFLNNAGYNLDKSEIMRHYTLVYHARDRVLRAYLDGLMFAEELGVDVNDCGPNPQEFIGFGTRHPGHPHVRTPSELQDFRMYAGVALTGPQVLVLATQHSMCTGRAETQDSSRWADDAGHDCAWYDDSSQRIPALCKGEETRLECPAACAPGVECLQDLVLRPKEQDHVWPRMMRLKPSGENGIICVASAVHPWRECMSPSWTLARNERGRAVAVSHGSPKVDVTNCTVINLTVDATCEFAPLQLHVTDEFTFSFWIKNTQEGFKSFRPSIQIFSSMEPLVPVAELAWHESTIKGLVWEFCNDNVVVENLRIEDVDELPQNEWAMITIMSGRGLDQSGKHMVAMGYNSRISLVEAGVAHCPPPSRDIMQGIAVSDEILIAGMEVRAYGMAPKEVQQKYYKERLIVQKQTGPVRSDWEGKAQTFKIKTKIFTKPAVLLAPPLIKTKRFSATSNCRTNISRQFISTYVPEQIQTSVCMWPRKCGSFENTMKCRSGEKPPLFFGADVSNDNFIEFLYTIVETDYIGRTANNIDYTSLQTRSFLDSMTKELNVVFIFFDPSAGIATRVSLVVDFQYGAASSSVSIDNLRCVEDQELIVSIACCTLLFIAVIANFLIKFRRTGFCQTRKIMALHHIVPISAIVTTGLHLWQLIDSRKTSTEILRKLSTVPWLEQATPLDAKFKMFIKADRMLFNYMKLQRYLSDAVCAQLVLLLLAVLAATRTHPRISILVKTVVSVADDLAHFFIIFFLLYLGFCVISVIRFGPRREGLSSFKKTAVSQFEMIHGELPEYNDQVMFFLYVVVFNMLVFVLMMNFLLALVIDGLEKVKKQIDEDDTEQPWLVDVVASVVRVVKAMRWGWPRLETIADGLEMQAARKTVSINQLVAVNSRWNIKSAIAFLKHYGRFQSLWPPGIRPGREIHSVSEAVEELEDFMAFMMKLKRKHRIIRDLERERQNSSKHNNALVPLMLPVTVQPVHTASRTQLGNARGEFCAWCDYDIEARESLAKGELCGPKLNEQNTCESQSQKVLQEAREVDVHTDLSCEGQIALQEARAALMRAQREHADAEEERLRAVAAREKARQERNRVVGHAQHVAQQQQLILEENRNAQDVWDRRSRDKQAIQRERVLAEKISEQLRQDIVVYSTESASETIPRMHVATMSRTVVQSYEGLINRV